MTYLLSSKGKLEIVANYDIHAIVNKKSQDSNLATLRNAFLG